MNEHTNGPNLLQAFTKILCGLHQMLDTVVLKSLGHESAGVKAYVETVESSLLIQGQGVQDEKRGMTVSDPCLDDHARSKVANQSPEKKIRAISDPILPRVSEAGDSIALRNRLAHLSIL